MLYIFQNHDYFFLEIFYGNFINFWSNFDQKFDFWPNIDFWSKVRLLAKFRFLSRVRFLAKFWFLIKCSTFCQISILDQKFFLAKFRFLTKSSTFGQISIFDQKFDFWPNFDFQREFRCLPSSTNIFLRWRPWQSNRCQLARSSWWSISIE